jgi:asparagine synthase (glutamine-hydrolysing)
MLHVDLWWRGHNLALDPGTYSYHAPSPWDNALSHTAYHNTVAVDDHDQMEQVSRFLWLPWLRGQVHRSQQSSEGSLAYWEGGHDGYTRLPCPVHYRRGIVRLEDDHWLILDALWSAGTHRYRLHWLLPDMPYTWDAEGRHLALQTPAGLYHLQLADLSETGAYSLVCADACSPRGWRAPYYGHREPALSLAVVEEACVAYFWTLFGPERCQVNVHDATILRIVAPCWEAALHLRQAAHAPLVTAISLVGRGDVSLQIP